MSRASGVVTLFWIISLLSAVAGGGIGALLFIVASGAPQQAAGAAMGCLVAIVPYVIARAIDEITRG